MDIEFHYYMTYLIAAHAGFKPGDALIIAHAAQSVDDNHIPVRLVDINDQVYENRISQTMDIVRPHEDALIYPVFHFIPGDPNAVTAKRVDGKTHLMNTTPDSALANDIIDAAIDSGCLYRIGVSAHGFVDTWAHQNFVGQRDDFNSFATTWLQKIKDNFLAVGHAHAEHRPDWPALVWQDTRLAVPDVDNRARFLDAAERLFEKLTRYVNPGIPIADFQSRSRQLRADLNADIGARDDENLNVQARVERYKQRGATHAYGGAPIPPYVVGTWFSEAIADNRNEVVDKMKFHFEVRYLQDVVDALNDVIANTSRQNVSWRNPDPTVHTKTNWYHFQEAVKAHLNECEAMLRASDLAQAA